MEAMEDGIGGGGGGTCYDSLNVKQEVEPDSSERDAESPDEGHNGLTIKDEPIEEDVSLSPSVAGSDADRASGSGDDREQVLNQKNNRRKRKIPMKLSQQSSVDDPDEEYNPPSLKLERPQITIESVQQANSSPHHHKPKQCSVMTEERARNQAINSLPRLTCPICGDKANGLHYGIYTCEACKNFFKRSVAFDAAKSYICKYNNSCNVNITEVDGVKMKGPRCQSCRYQACLDAGMYHSGVQRTRGGRHGYSPMKQRSGSIEKYPTVNTPNISAVMAAAAAANENAAYEPAEVVSVSMSPSDLSSEQADDQQQQQAPASQVQHSFLQQSQIWEKFISDNARNELELLKSRTCIAETLLAEKTKQLDIVQKQVEMLKNHLLTADQLNKEQAITIESLKRRLQNGSASSTAAPTNGKANGGSNGDHQKSRVFENGGVTITPVVTTTSPAPTNNGNNHVYSQNLLSHLLQKSGNNSNDMATIEPVHESSRGKS